MRTPQLLALLTTLALAPATHAANPLFNHSLKSEVTDDGHERTTIVRRSKVVCEKPFTDPSLGTVERLLNRYAMTPDSMEISRVRKHFQKTYRQEVIHYRLCLDFAHGHISREEYVASLDKLLLSRD